MYGVGKRAYPIPAVLLARLAVDTGFHGRGIGSKLLLHALSQIAKASRHVGFEGVVVHAIDRDAVTFYAQRGFIRFEDHDLQLFTPVKNLLTTQDLTSFVLGAAMERARAVLAEDRILRLTPHEVNQLERALDSEPEVIPQLRAFTQRFSVNREDASA